MMMSECYYYRTGKSKHHKTQPREANKIMYVVMTRKQSTDGVDLSATTTVLVATS